MYYYFDINGTILLSDAAGGKTTEQAVGQLVAQSIRLPDDTTLEDHIKTTVLEKKKQRETYLQVENYVEQHFPDLIEKVQELLPKYTYLARETESRQGIFQSFYEVVKYIIATDPQATIILNTFGDDLPLVTRALGFPDGPWTDLEKLSLKDILTLNHDLLPAQVYAWKSSYQLWKGEGIGKPIFCDYESFFFDDNDTATVIDEYGITEDIPDHIHIFRVNTAEALSDPQYFVQRIRAAKKR